MTLIEVFADVACPFTHVGLRRLVARRAELARDDVVLRVRAWPLELVNGVTLDPAFVAEEVAALRGQVAPELFAGFDPAAFPASSLGALDLAHAAYRQGDQTGERVSLELRTALFEEGRDIADPAVLAVIAMAHDVTVEPEEDRAGVRADWEEGVRRGVVGSPYFFAGDQGWFCPVLEISHGPEGFAIRVDATGMAPFLDACFAA